MARRPKLKLTSTTVARAKYPASLGDKKGTYRIADGDGLYLQISHTGAKSWIYLFRWRDNPNDEKSKIKEMGLGSIHTVDLVEARKAAQDAAKLVANGKNPIIERRTRAATPSNPTIPTFREYGEKMIDAWSLGWKTTKSTDPTDLDEFGNPAESNKQLTNWTRTLTSDLAHLCPLRLDAITTADVVTALLPLWNKKQATADKAMQRAAKILSAAKVDGHRSGDNPAVWKDSGMSRATLWRTLKKYEVPTFKIGARTYIDVVEVQKLKSRLIAESSNAPQRGRPRNQARPG